MIAATQTAVAVLGNPGLSRHHSLERHLRDALCIRVHPPQEDAVLLAGGSLLVFRKRHYAQGSGRHTAVNAGK